MSILLEIVDSSLEKSNETFLSENNAITQIYLCIIKKDSWVKEEFCRDFGPFVKYFCFFYVKSTKGD